MMASPLAAASSRASSPDSRPHSPQAKTATNIDDLTAALSNFSRAHTPDPPIICCCQRQDCETTKSWAGYRAKLESRLVLSAEVGQALLERHEAYVRRQDTTLSRQASSIFIETDEDVSLYQQVNYLTKKLDTVNEEYSLTETRLNEILIKHEMSEASNRTIMRELQDARATIGRLSAQQTRSVGWEMRLSQAMQERDDMQQERDSETHRAKIAESKAAVFVEKCTKLQKEVHVLREEVDNFRTSRADFSKSVLDEARSRLESFQHSLGRDQTREDPETTLVLESLVADNETLKRDTAELQNLLVEAREDVRILREELEEHRASAPSGYDDVTKVGTPPPGTLYLPNTPGYMRRRGHRATNSVASTSSMLHGPPHTSNQLLSSLTRPGRFTDEDAIAEWRETQADSLELVRRPHSPFDSLCPPDTTLHGGEADYKGLHGTSPASPRGNVKSLMLLTRSRGVQTDPPSGNPYPSPRPTMLGVERDSTPSTPTPDRSDTSSISQQDPRTAGAVTALIERVSSLLVKMIQTDIKSLANRLKRQHLPGGDLRHLSNSTIASILNEVGVLRIPGGSGKDDANSLLTVTRAETKALLRLFKDIFTELGSLRGLINEVTLDPSVANKLRKEATEPEKPKDDPRPASAMGGWIAPIQKLFAAPTTGPSSGTDPAGNTTSKYGPSELGRGRPQARVAPKLAPAISASSMTVNVEFASTGVRKTDTSNGSMRVSSVPVNMPANPSPNVSGPTALTRPIALPHSSSRNLMGIFAGAPQSSSGTDAWVVLPKGDRVRQLKQAVSSAHLGVDGGGGGGGVSGMRRSATRNVNRLSRNVDAVLDQNDDSAPDFRETLQRTLRPRGLSDSSIHTTFMKGEPTESAAEKPPDPPQESVPAAAQPPALPEQVTSTLPSSEIEALSSSTDRRQTGGRKGRPQSPPSKRGKAWASWVTSGHFNDGGISDHDLLIGSPREEGLLRPGAWMRRGL